MAPESWNKPWPLGVLLFGLLMLVLAVVGAFTGKIYGKGGTADRATDPADFWITFVVQCLAGVFLIWYWAFVMVH
jgi:hypothetical protein